MESVAELLQLEGCVLQDWRREGSCAVLEARWEERPGVCAACGETKHYSHGWRKRRLAHITLGELRCDLELSFQRWQCCHCGKVCPPAIPWAPPRSRLTEALRRFIAWQIVKLKASVEGVAQWLQAGWHTVWRCLCLPFQGLPTEDELLHLCLDEVFFREPQQYVTVLSTARGTVLGIAPGRGQTPSAALLAALPAEVSANVVTLATDFNAGQRRAALDALPIADVCADHFHLVRLIRDMLRACRPRQRAAGLVAAAQLRQLLKHCEPRLVRWWLNRWEESTGPLHTLWKTVDAWQAEIENFIQTRRSTGPAEALNRRISLLRRIAGGYTNLSNFSQRILLLNQASHH